MRRVTSWIRAVACVGAGWLAVDLPAMGQEVAWGRGRARPLPAACPVPEAVVAPAPTKDTAPATGPTTGPDRKPATAPAPVAPPVAVPATPPSVQPPATTTPSPAPSPDLTAAPEGSLGLGGDTVSLLDSSVGYIDNAIPGNQVRLRFDSLYHINRASRAEFFYAKGGPQGPGLPQPDTLIDAQEFFAYFESLWDRDLSIFVEAPIRLIDPEINANSAGYGDMNAGFKYAFINKPCHVASFQFRTFVPTGDADRGLGTHHVSLEPAFLFWEKLSPKVNLYGELRYWIPVGGTDFAGDVVRYGIGLSYGQPKDQFWVTPVAELVGWTVLDGKELAVAAPPIAAVQDADGDTIINAKFGARFGMGTGADFYAGYGRALTGDVWYKDVIRLEFRLLY